jgi:hypothetical protein
VEGQGQMALEVMMKARRAAARFTIRVRAITQ